MRFQAFELMKAPRACAVRNLALLALGLQSLQAHTAYLLLQGGNNNTYCHDSPLNWFNWDQAASDTKGFARYFQCLVHFRYRNR